MTLSTLSLEQLLDIFKTLGGKVSSQITYEDREKTVKSLLRFLKLWPLLIKFDIKDIELILGYDSVVRVKIVYPTCYIYLFPSGTVDIVILPEYYLEKMRGEVSSLVDQAIREALAFYRWLKPSENCITSIREILNKRANVRDMSNICFRLEDFEEAIKHAEAGDLDSATRRILYSCFTDTPYAVYLSRTDLEHTDDENCPLLAEKASKNLYSLIVKTFLDKYMKGQFPELAELIHTLKTETLI